MKRVFFVTGYDDRFPVEVVGESKYQDNIQNIIVYVGDDEKRFRDDSFTAELILEDDNHYEPGNAVRVDIDGQTVGYLKEAQAKRYRKGLKELGLPDVVGQCGALIAGRHNEYHGDKIFGVWLDLDLKNLQIEKERLPVKIVERKADNPISIPPIETPRSAPVAIATKPAKPKRKLSKPAKIAIFVVAVVVVLCLIPLCTGMVDGVIGIINSIQK